jgi:hypothetical protein
MTLQIKVELNRVADVGIDHSAGATITAFVGILLTRWEEADMMPFADYDHGQLWHFLHAHCFASG